jgi:uncharacterized RDD family membrane protein YckC
MANGQRGVDMAQFGGFWIRVVAYIIDAIVMTIVSIPIGLIFGISMMAGFDPSVGADPEAMAGANLMANLLSIVLGWLYYALMESSAMQATLGKKALGMIVTDENGQRIGFGRATGRYFAKILSALILLIGFIMVAFTERKQGLHDKLAGTLVVRGEPGQTAHAGVFE